MRANNKNDGFGVRHMKKGQNVLPARLVANFSTVLHYFLAFLILLLALTALIASYRWRMEHDTPLLHYAAFLINELNYVPYRDVFETSMPLTFLFHMLIGSLFGYGDAAFRLVDIALICALTASTAVVLRRFSWPAAFAGVSVFIIVYLSYGQAQSLQRDYIGVVLVAFSLLVLNYCRLNNSYRSGIIIGLLFSCAFLIKPHLILGLPVIMLAHYALLKGFGEVNVKRLLAFIGFGFFVPNFLVILWLWNIGGLAAFIEMLTQYLPLHNQITSIDLSSLAELLKQLWGKYIHFGGYQVLMMGSCLGVLYAIIFCKLSLQDKILVKTIAGLIAVYSIYPVIGLKFWPYHYFPLLYFSALGFGLLLTPANKGFGGEGKSYLVGIAALSIFVIIFPMTFKMVKFQNYSHYLWRQLQPEYVAPAPKLGVVDEIAVFLKNNVKPGDRVQPLDWSRGVNHAMLIAETPLATRYMYDYHFYHHIDNPFIRKIRKEFIDDLRSVKPRFIISVYDAFKPWLSGSNTTREFNELNSFVDDNYVEIYDRKGVYRIYERVDQ